MIAILAEAVGMVRLVGVATLVRLLVVASVMVAGVAHELGPVLPSHVKANAHVGKILEQVVEERLILIVKIEVEVVIFVKEYLKVLNLLGGY